MGDIQNEKDISIFQIEEDERLGRWTEMNTCLNGGFLVETVIPNAAILY